MGCETGKLTLGASIFSVHSFYGILYIIIPTEFGPAVGLHFGVEVIVVGPLKNFSMEPS